MEHIGDGRQRLHADPALMERFAHLLERDPGFALRNLSQCVRMWLEDRPTIATNLRRGCASRLENTLQKLDRGRRAHIKALRSRSGRSSGCDTPHDPPAQILGQRCRHRELHRSQLPRLI
jgi:hypothetical protein